MPSETERNEILSHLLAYADENRFRLLAARDYGSRARNLSDSSSDYDVFFLFAQPPAEYALGAATDTYTKSVPASENELGVEIELHGWNIRQFIGSDGVAGSNPTAIEFCLSPEQYFVNDTIAKQLEAICAHGASQFKPYALINHYRSMAASNYGKYIEGDYRLADDASWNDLLYPAEPSWGAIAHESTEGLTVSEQESTIGTDEITVVGEFTQTPYLGTIGMDEAKDRGLVKQTTQDPTVKRHLNIAQALIKARYIENNHEAPIMDFTELLRQCVGADWLPDVVYAQLGRLIAQKKQGSGSKERELPSVAEWIEAELGREIEPEPHVQRQPETAVVNRHARELYNSLDWSGIN